MKGDMCGGGARHRDDAGDRAAQAEASTSRRLCRRRRTCPAATPPSPGDVVRAMNGKTIEVVNTDAEGRLILADALCYALQLDLTPIIDVATLTGAISIALGKVAYGVMSNDATPDRAHPRRPPTAAGEKCWQFPLYDEYKGTEQAPGRGHQATAAGAARGRSRRRCSSRSSSTTRPGCISTSPASTSTTTRKGSIVKGASGTPCAR